MSTQLPNDGQELSGLSLLDADQIGFVYFITERGRNDAPIKIGHTKRTPDARLGDIITMSPVELEIVAWARGSVWHERALHERFASDRMHGEWFKSTPALRDLVDKVRRECDLGIELTDESISQLRQINFLARGAIEIKSPACGPTCSFCGASRKDRFLLIRAPGPNVHICNDCVEISVEVIGKRSVLDVAKSAQALLAAFARLSAELQQIVDRYGDPE